MQEKSPREVRIWKEKNKKKKLPPNSSSSSSRSPAARKPMLSPPFSVLISFATGLTCCQQASPTTQSPWRSQACPAVGQQDRSLARPKLCQTRARR